MLALLSVLALLGLLCAVYGWFEAGWLRTRVVDIHVPGLPPALNGLRVGHLSDLHLGAALSAATRRAMRAAEWVAARGPDLVCVTGDLVFIHVVSADSRPFSISSSIRTWSWETTTSPSPATRSRERQSYAISRRRPYCGTRPRRSSCEGERVSVVGVDPETYRRGGARPDRLIDADGSFRMLLCHFPAIVRRLPARSFDLILAGHLHAGQICVPFFGRRLTLAHPRAAFVAGV